MPMPPDELERRRAAANPPRDPDDELLETGQEEVFSRTEVASGRIEHDSHAGHHGGVAPGLTRRDEAQTERQAPDNAGPGEPAGGE